MTASAVAAALQVFDTAALEALANAGLVRRAQRDVADGKVALGGADGDGVSVLADGATVVIDRRGPGFARCSCPAPGLCRHRIAAVLLLQAGAGDAAAVPEGAAAAALQAEIAALVPDDIARWAGRAGWRAALEIAAEGGDVAIAGAALVVRLAGSDDDIRYLAGQGLAGMVSRSRPAKLKALHAAAILVARGHFGLAPPVVVAGEPVAVAAGIDPGFLAEVTAALAQSARSALNLAPAALEDQLFMLSVSSRADHLPRLAAQLRGLAAQLRDRRRRSLGFDPDQCLAAIADAFALAGALRGADANPALVGSVRQGYAPIGDVVLTGMGSEVWRTPAGARGVTGHFHEAGTARWFTASLSRGAGLDPGFDPVAAYAAAPIWGGQTLATLARSRFRLRDAAASASGRLSMAAGVRAEAVTQRGEIEMGFDTWTALRDHLRLALAGGLAAASVASVAVALRPRRVGRPWFDDLRQSLIWPVEDDDGVWIGLSLDHGAERPQLVDALEKVAARGWHGSISVLASAGPKAYLLRPFALATGDAMVNLGLDGLQALPALGLGQRAAGLARDIGLMLGRLPNGTVQRPPGVPMIVVAAAAQLLVDLAELGMEVLTADQAARLAGAAEQLRSVGLASAATRLAAVDTPQGAARWPALLAAAFAVQSARRRLLELPVVVV